MKVTNRLNDCNVSNEMTVCRITNESTYWYVIASIHYLVTGMTLVT
jgi:hypothetical protein